MASIILLRIDNMSFWVNERIILAKAENNSEGINESVQKKIPT